MSHGSIPPYIHGEYRGGRNDVRPSRPMGRSLERTADYTLGHAGRQIRLGPVAFWTTVGALVVMAIWSIVTGTYFAFRDDVLTRLISRQAEMQYAYEDRIAELRSQVDRLASRQLLDQEQYEQKLDGLVRRQSLLESPPDREARRESRPPGANYGVALPVGGIEAALARLQTSLDRVETSQMAVLNSIEETYDSKASRIRRVLLDLGLELGKATGKMPSSPVGGPFVPIKLRSEAGAFERQLFRINTARIQVDRLTRTLAVVPVRKPMPGEIDTTSGFGMRIDPFLRMPAMHTGLDFRGEPGEPIRVTAGGTVTHSGWSGGYGKMVEIDHGNGLATRYAHLSAIDVDVGEKVRIGQTIGKLGSTGRSTGPHHPATLAAGPRAA